MITESIRAPRRPSVNAGMRCIAIAVSLVIALPVLAASEGGQRKAVADRKAQAGKPVRAPAAHARTRAPDVTAHEKTTGPAPAVIPGVTPPVAAVADTIATAAVSSPTLMPLPSEVARENAAAPPVNPYLAGWFRPTPASELPNLAARQLAANTQWAIESVTTLPGKVVDALPSIKRVFPTGGRELWVVNAKCPAEMVTGQYFFPANALRDAVNGLLGTLNEYQVLTFDIQLVCS